jgi:hypothetical protein
LLSSVAIISFKNSVYTKICFQHLVIATPDKLYEAAEAERRNEHEE